VSPPCLDFDFRRWRSRLKINSEKLCWQPFSHCACHPNLPGRTPFTEDSCYTQSRDQFSHSSTSPALHTARQQCFFKRWNALWVRGHGSRTACPPLSSGGNLTSTSLQLTVRSLDRLHIKRADLTCYIHRHIYGGTDYTGLHYDISRRRNTIYRCSLLRCRLSHPEWSQYVSPSRAPNHSVANLV
jgi:hypothetical protein